MAMIVSDMDEGVLITAQKTAFVIERRRHINEQPSGWKRFLIRAWFVWGGRFVYFLLREPVPDVNGMWKEGQCICTNEQRADEMLFDESYCAQELPINESLPAETSKFGKHWFGKSAAERAYANHQMKYVSIEGKVLNKMSERASDIINLTQLH